jgi:arylformamidase
VPRPSWIDVSVILREPMPVWPGSAGFRLVRYQAIEEGAAANASRVACDVHVGTHVDAPLHFLRDGTDVAAMSLDDLIGHATVVEIPDEVDRIDAATLDRITLAPGTRRVLFKTRNSALWAGDVRHFRSDYVALTLDAASRLAQAGVRLVGVDYLSVQCFEDDPETHRVLLRAGIVIVEGLDLSAVTPGQYELVCLPLRLLGAEGAPARAVLRALE